MTIAFYSENGPGTADRDWNELDELWRACGGYVESYAVCDGLQLICGEVPADSRITAILPAGQAVRGPCLVVRVDDEGEIVDLTPEDIEHLDACVLIGNIIDLAHYVRRFSVIAKRLAETVAEAEP